MHGILSWAVAVVMILREFNFDIAPILAGAGVIGLAVGFGAQNLVRDVISGLFMLIENQISVNDVVVINGIYFAESSMPFKFQIDGTTREELKQIVREVLAGSQTGGGPGQ